jgi:DNA-3-methyladenine glycosylase I
MLNRTRCDWVNPQSELEIVYHDQEWGVPSYIDTHLFEMLILEGAQAGLSWSTILKKRDGYRKAFDHFNAERMARYTPRKVETLMTNPEIVRNRLKVESAVTNARIYLDILESEHSFSDYIWQFVDGIPRQNRWQRLEEIPVTTTESDAMSKALKKRGFKFVGSTICYAYMQAVGMVNDHTTHCFRHRQILNLSP